MVCGLCSQKRASYYGQNLQPCPKNPTSDKLTLLWSGQEAQPHPLQNNREVMQQKKLINLFSQHDYSLLSKRHPQGVCQPCRARPRLGRASSTGVRCLSPMLSEIRASFQRLWVKKENKSDAVEAGQWHPCCGAACAQEMSPL